MPKRSSKKKSKDTNILAAKIVKEATEENEEPKEVVRDAGENEVEEETQDESKNPNAQALGRLGGLKGGKARASKLTPERRREIARLAAQARWKKSD